MNEGKTLVHECQNLIDQSFPLAHQVQILAREVSNLVDGVKSLEGLKTF